MTGQDADFLVIGSGFGGAVSALRLAQKGYSVVVLEQGRRFEVRAPLLALTKADLVKPAALAETVAATKAAIARHVGAFPRLHVTSAEKGLGIADLRAELAALAAPAP